jgi:hypothetical protein
VKQVCAVQSRQAHGVWENDIISSVQSYTIAFILYYGNGDCSIAIHHLAAWSSRRGGYQEWIQLSDTAEVG